MFYIIVKIYKIILIKKKFIEKYNYLNILEKIHLNIINYVYFIKLMKIIINYLL